MPIAPDPRERAAAVQVPAAGVWRFDVVAGLTAAAVVLPKAMAYAAVAGLPVAVGLYTAFIPMIVYALLGTSRVLSVSSTTTLAILAGTELALVVPDGDPARLVTATATLTVLVGGMLVLARLMRLGFVADFISAPVLTGFKAGIGLVIVLDQVPKLLGTHITKQGFFPDLLSVAQHVPETSLLTLAVAIATLVDPGGDGAPLAALARAAGGGRRGDRGVVVPGPRLARRLDRRSHSPGAALDHLARSRARHAAAAGGGRDRADELHRNDRRRSCVRPPRRSAGRCQSRADRHRGEQPGRCVVGRDAGGRRNVADRGRQRRRGPHPARGAGHGGRRAGDHALPRAAARAAAERDAGDDRHRLFDRPDPARRIRRHPQGADDGVSLGRGRRARRAAVRDAAGDRRGDHRFADRPVEPGRAADGACHRPQARRRRPAAALAREPGRRDVRGPPDPPARGPPVLRQRAERRRSGQGVDAGASAARARARLQQGARHRVFGAANAHREREAGDRTRPGRSGSRVSTPACSRSFAAPASTSSWGAIACCSTREW